MPFLVGPTQPAVSVFRNWDNKNQSLFFFWGEQNKKRMKLIMTIRKTNGQFPGRNKRETNGVRPMRTDMSVVSRSKMYKGANRSNKGLRMSNYLVRISIVALLLLFFYLAFLLIGIDFDLLLIKKKSMLLAKGLHFLFSRLGWFGLLVAGLMVLEESGSWSYMMQPPDASGASSSNAGNHSVPPIGQGVEDPNYEVPQDEVWEAVEASEERKLRNSKEWKETERHLLKIEEGKKAIGQRAKEIAQGKGFNPGRCEAVEDAAKYIAEDVPEKQQLGFLAKLMRDLNNPNSEAWERIDEDIQKWRSWED